MDPSLRQFALEVIDSEASAVKGLARAVGEALVGALGPGVVGLLEGVLGEVRGLRMELRERARLWDDVRGAKEMLSRTSTAPIAVPGVDQALHLTRDELEQVVAPLLHRAVRRAADVIKASGLRPRDLAGLFLVGGSSRVPLVAP